MTDFPDLAPGLSRLSTLCCSFSSKTKDSVAKLVAGPGVYICNECIDLCSQIVGTEATPRVHAWHDQPDDELLAALAKIQAVVPQVDAAIHDYVDLLRERAVSWTRIG